MRGAFCWVILLPCATVATAAPRTLGFVITTWNIAAYETRFADECPLGLNPGYDELWWRGLSKPDRAKFTDNITDCP